MTRRRGAVIFVVILSWLMVGPLGVVSATYSVSPSVTGTISLGATLIPQQIAVSPDGSTAYVTESYGKQIQIVSTSSNQLIGTIPLTGLTSPCPSDFAPYGIAVSPDASTLFVTEYFGNGINFGKYIAIINLRTSPQTVECVDTSTTGYQPKSIVVTPNGRYAYFSNEAVDNIPETPETEGRVGILDTVTKSIAGVITFPGTSLLSSLAMTANGERIYVTGFVSVSYANLSETPPASATAGVPVVGGISTPQAVVVSPNGETVYVAATADENVAVIRTSDWNVSRIALEPPVVSGGELSPRGIAISPDGARVFVTEFSANLVTVIDTATNARVGPALPVGQGPLGVVVSPSSYPAYVVNSGGPSLSVIDTGWRGPVTISPSVSSVSATVGSALTPVTFTASGYLGSPTYAITPGLPAGLTFNASTGTISGTPTAASETTSYTITATTGVQSATANVTITVAAIPGPTPDPTPEPTPSVSVKKDKVLTTSSLVKTAGLKAPKKSKISFKVSKADTKICRVLPKGKGIKALKKGTCTVTVAVKPKKGKATKQNVQIIVL